MGTSTNGIEARRRRLAGYALILLAPAPTIGVLCGLPEGAGALGKGVYAAMKVWILILPLAWLILVERAWVWPTWSWRGLGAGAVWGAAIAAAILLAFMVFGESLIDSGKVRAVAAQTGLGDPRVFIPFFLYLCLVNSLLEEYVWRWFVYGRCRDLLAGMPGWAAVVVSSLLFTVHHAVALALQMSWQPALLGSIGVLVGGMVWAGLYQRYGSIWPAWISHILADVAVAVAAWRLIFGG